MNDLKIRSLVTHNMLKAYGRAQQAPTAQGSGFAELLTNSLQKVDQAQKTADLAVEQAVMGQEQDLHRVMIAQEEASLTFELMMEVRNRLLEAYQQIMQMQV